jgi:hypothetical protein
MNEHVRAAELLTWKVNGRLAGADAEWLEAHLQVCGACRQELSAQQQIRDAIAREPTVEFAPQASFNRLWARIENDGTDSAATRPPTAAGARRSGWAAGPWTRATLAAQAVLVALLGGALWHDWTIRPAADYRTVTEAPAIAARGPVITAIFDDRVRLADVKDILAGSGLVIASGPTAAGVYTLVPAEADQASLPPTALARLRADPRVRFAEAGAP